MTCLPVDRTVALLTYACVVSACGSPGALPAPSASERLTSASATGLASASVAGPPRSPSPLHERGETLETKGPTGPGCRVTVTETEGCAPEAIAALVTPARARLEACRGPRGGKVRIRVRQGASPGALAFELSPGSTLDPTSRQCVLDALNAIQIDESSTAWTGPTVRPSGFTSVLTVEW